jgi:pimeloyl-ACP methyl ester carboxylesterase
VLRRLEAKPAVVTLKGTKDAKTGEPVTIALGHEDFQREAFLKGPDGPAFVLAAYHERYEGWATTTSFQRRARNVEMPVIGPLIDTSLGVTPKRRYLLRTDPATEFLGHWNFDSYLATADIWPTEDVGDEFRTDKVTNIPVVFVNGDWDTQTPIENTLGIAPYFPKKHVLIVERGGHGAMNQLSQNHPKTKEALVQFLRTGDMNGLPVRISVPPPKWSAPSFELKPSK